MEKNKMGYMPIPKLILTMSLPAIFSMMTQALYNIVDSIFVAQIGEAAITALSLAFPVQLVIVACFVGMGVGINSLISRSLGSKNYEQAALAAEHGFFIASILYGFVALMGVLVMPSFVRMFTDDPIIIEYTIQYLEIIMVFAFGRIFAQAGVSILQGSGEMVIPMFSQLIGAIGNIILDPIMIFGLFGFPALGVKGAAIATITAQIISMIFVLLMVFKFKRVLAFKPLSFRINHNILKKILVVGLPAAIMQAVGSVMLTGLNLILASFTTTAVAVLGIYYRLQSFIFLPIFGLSQGMMPIIGFNYGAKSRDRLLKALKMGMVMAIIYMTLGFIVFQIFPRQLILWFKGTDELLQIGIRAFRIISLGYPLAAVSIVLSTAFQGMGQAHLSMMVSIFRQIVLLLPSAWLLGHFGSLEMVWFAFIISEIGGVIMVVSFFYKLYRSKIEPL
ncbi:MATE family efflux transporter [Fusibacter ferrireducens]|uniref:Probable multidrug resistance protein NorM n=1 Tax=Fusibacter ferrireducens TaxID=2785058 RepID=A0ABR9ZS47_9FIRM|nr:MATE family efflux transporter [Fusibacter ferrireducens]MBF4692943.1 MATE family efflux transporter [Fusibacter ferrireducens]